MKITLFSDTHNEHERVDPWLRGGDILAFCGDMSRSGSLPEIKKFLDWFGQQDQYEHRIFIAGNHDKLFQNSHGLAKSLIPDNVEYLQDQITCIKGYFIWGSPMTPAYKRWAFMYSRGAEAKRVWDMIPPEIDILLTHGPPLDVLDQTEEKFHAITVDTATGKTKKTLDYTLPSNVGCKELGETVKLIKPKLHAFGHIHECGGRILLGKDTTFINAACMSKTMDFKNPPITVELEDK